MTMTGLDKVNLGLWILIGAAGIAFIVILASKAREPAIAPRPDTVFVRDIVESKARAETTRMVVSKVKTLIDTLPGDTVFVPKETIREVLVECESCAAKLERLAFICDSVRKVDRDSIARLNRRIAQLEKHRTYAAVGGLLAGGFVACR